MIFFVFSKTVEYFDNLPVSLKMKLLKIYQLDFELFGYDWKKYFENT